MKTPRTLSFHVALWLGGRTLQSNVREIARIVEGVNLMLRRLEQGADDGAIQRAQASLAEVREAIEGLEVTSAEAKSTALDKLSAFEKSLLAVLQSIKAASGLRPGRPDPPSRESQ